MAIVPLGPWEPDKGPFDPKAIDTVSNLNPLSNGWGPYPSLQEVGASLGSQCLGAWYVRSSDGTFSVIAGTATGLYLYNAGTWSDISGGSAPYNVADGQFWQALQFGTKFIVVNLNDPPQVYDVDLGGTFGDLAGTPPQAKFIWIAGDFVCLGYLKVGADEFPQRIHWSGVNNAEQWTISRLTGSDRQDMPDGDDITGGFGFPGGARILQRKAKRAMVFTGGQFIFEIKVLDAFRGSPAPYSIVPISANDYVFWRTDGICRGDDNTPIGAQRVDNFLFDIGGDLNIDTLDKVQGVADPFQKCVMWSYTSQDATQKVLCWDWELDRFFPLDVAAELVFSATTPGVTLEGLDAFCATIEDLTPSMDSRFWKGGAPTLGAFTSSDKIAFFSGDPLEGTIETNSVELNENMRSFANAVRIEGDPGALTTVAAGVAQLPSDAVTFKPAATRSGRTGVYPCRADGYFHRFRVTTSDADTSWSVLHGVSVDAIPSGNA